MHVQHVMTRDDRGENRLVMVCDGHTEIVVNGYGGEGYTIAVRNIDPSRPTRDPAATLREVLGETPNWGLALVWAEPVTIAHLVINVLENQ